MNTSNEKAMRLALEALTYKEQGVVSGKKDLTNRAIKALEEALAKQEQGEPVGEMTPRRAEMFMSRFKHEEKMLGPNEQAALDYVIAMLVAKQEPYGWAYESHGRFTCNAHPIFWKTRKAETHTEDFWEEIPLYRHPQPKREPLTDEQKSIRVWGWVWKDKRHEGDLYSPSYTPAQHVPRGELLALVDPADLHNPLENTAWHIPTKAAHGIHPSDFKEKNT